ncbi:hypothetical protein EYZ11_006376 [Aspergillus tanneri]|uniref:Uncharacterized protein n=1 Tax=Aspergillus tanneri TaxID=1220188 RepID=A0A4S3JHV1_9EURO|nr:hypothetical protein EYZ11_006376 [Aspergillus tanneri]
MDPFSRGLPGLTGRGLPSHHFHHRFHRLCRITNSRQVISLVDDVTYRQPLDPTRKITPPEEKEMHARDKQQPAASASKFKSPYDEAYAYYHECKAWAHPRVATAPFERRRPLEDYEKQLAIKMSVGDWNKLRRDLDLDSKDESYPRFSFDASTSTLIIQCMPSPIHQSISSILIEEIMISKAAVPVNLRRQTQALFDEDFKSFGGQWSGSDKRPDLGIGVRNANNEMELKWVLEVGFSETYKQLKNDIRLWLEGSSEVSMVTIVKFCETPSYRCPFPRDPIYGDDEEELDTLQALGIPSDVREILKKDVVFEGEYGPATYKRLTWVGKISEVWMETWVRGADGKAVQRGIAEDLMQADQVQLDFGDLLPHGYPQTITIDLEQFRSILKDSICKMAVNRCMDAIKDYKERHGEGRGDGDYHG